MNPFIKNMYNKIWFEFNLPLAIFTPVKYLIE